MLARLDSTTEGRTLAPRANSVEAGAAIDRFIVAWKERHHRLRAAFGADGRIHLPLRARAPVIHRNRAPTRRAKPSVCPALGTAPRLIHQSPTGVELLLTCRPNEIFPTLPTIQHDVAVGHGSLPKHVVGRAVGWVVLRPVPTLETGSLATPS